MPIWFEVTALMLVFYGLGLMLGWGLWGRSVTVHSEDEPHSKDTK